MTKDEVKEKFASHEVENERRSVSDASSEPVKHRDKKDKQNKPMTKVVIRKLPPSMTEEEFKEQISPIAENDYFSYEKPDKTLGHTYQFCRAYINFINPQDVFDFKDKFDDYVFVDSRGVEYPAVVEFAPSQKIPKYRVLQKNKDVVSQIGTIELDLDYINYVENLQSQNIQNEKPVKKAEYSYQVPSVESKNKIITPLVGYVRQMNLEKQMKKEDKKRRDIERKKVDQERKKETEKMHSTDTNNYRTILVQDSNSLQKDESKKNTESKHEKEKTYQKDTKGKSKKEDRPNKSNKDKDVKNTSKQQKIREDRAKKTEVPKEQNEPTERKTEEKRGKSYLRMRQEKMKLAEKKNANESTSKAAEKITADEKKTTDVESSSISSEEQTKKILKRPNVQDKNLETTDDCACNKIKQSMSDSDKDEKSIENASHRISKRRSSLESGGDSCSSLKSSSSGNAKDNSSEDRLRRHKSLDGSNKGNLQKTEVEGDGDKEKKDPRLERRIRNKDRPAMEIYRPGMGKFSKQRIEREKGEERVTPSQSPTPTSSSSSSGFKSNRSNSVEVRSMTFKRSVHRE
ncbi:hypothetical protein TKK_0008320 [Trichogramma kaykai]|uniref:UPF3 domain-containing protein n=1 Tax=Trichogramma kaykai TaxID=54128 RepID=A0ABD2X617_9HYME